MLLKPSGKIKYEKLGHHQTQQVHKVKRFYENAAQVTTNILFYNFFVIRIVELNYKRMIFK